MVDATVTLYKDIGLDSNFNRTMYFTSKSQQTTWFNNIPANQRTTLTDVNYNKVQNSFYIHEQLGDVYGYTYVRLQDIDESGRTYYGFISNVTLVDEETTRFDIVLDPIQTFMTEWELGECYVYKEHCDRWNTTNIPIRITPGQDGINANMKATTYKEIKVASNIPNVELVYGIIIFTTTRPFNFPVTSGGEVTDWETRDNSMQYAIIPLFKDSTKADDILYYRASYSIGYGATKNEVNLRLPTFNEFASGTAVSILGIDPNSVIGSYILPTIGCSVNVFNYNDTYAITMFDSAENLNQAYLTGGENPNAPTYPMTVWIDTEGSTPNEVTVGCQLLRQQDIFALMTTDDVGVSISDVVSVPTKPSDTSTPSDTFEPALYMYPYTIRSIVANGSIVGNIPDVSIFTNENKRIAICTNVKASGVQNYIYYGDNSTSELRNKKLVEGNSFLIGTNTADVLGDAYLSYCMTARDSDRRMMWSSIASNTINQAVFMGYGGALVGSRSNSGKNDPMKNADSVDVPNYGRAMMTAMGYGIASSLVTSAVSGIDVWVQQEAKEQTIRNTPPDTVALGSGAGIIDSGEFGYYYIERRCDDVNWKTAYDKFRKYGYTVNSMETPNIQSRKYFNYICTGNTTIKGAIPANIKQDLVNIFEKGITFFHADHCNTTEYPEYENIERSLIS